MNRGGAETLIMNLYRHMDRRKVQFDFLTCKEGVYDEEIKSLGGVVHRMPYVTEAGHRGYMRSLKQFFVAHHYQVVHAHMDRMSGLVIREAKKAAVPIRIVHSHNTASEGGFLSKGYKYYAGRSIKTDHTHLYACSQAAADWLFQKDASQAHILKNGIDIDTFLFNESSRRQIRTALNIPDNAFVLGHVGRFNKQKNHDGLIEIFAEVHQQLPHAILLLAGDGVLKKKIQSRVNALGLNNHVRFLGVRENIPELLHAFDLFVFPSLHEGLPVTLIEAQAAGLPCLISDTITSEVDLNLHLVHYLPLSDHAAWSDAIQLLSYRTQARLISGEALKQHGYDIKQTAADLQDAYLSYGSEDHEAAHNIHAYV
nr:glycosyltransferase family 1 protein [Lentibacillus sp. JNUCC-1]